MKTLKILGVSLLFVFASVVYGAQCPAAGGSLGDFGGQNYGFFSHVNLKADPNNWRAANIVCDYNNNGTANAASQNGLKSLATVSGNWQVVNNDICSCKSHSPGDCQFEIINNSPNVSPSIKCGTFIISLSSGN